MQRVEARERAVLAAQAALDKKAEDVRILDLRGITLIADYFVIASGRNVQQVQAITDHVRDRLEERGARPRGIEGYAAGRWVLVDYGDVVVHVFLDAERRYYGLERVWGDAPELALEAPTGGPYNEGRVEARR